MFGVSEDTFLRCMDVVMDALIANLQLIIIQWPKQSELHEFTRQI